MTSYNLHASWKMSNCVNCDFPYKIETLIYHLANKIIQSIKQIFRSYTSVKPHQYTPDEPSDCLTKPVKMSTHLSWFCNYDTSCIFSSISEFLTKLKNKVSLWDMMPSCLQEIGLRTKYCSVLSSHQHFFGFNSKFKEKETMKFISTHIFQKGKMK